MTAAVESMAYTNEVPWHGLGENVGDLKDVKAWMKRGKIDWRVARQPMFWASTEFAKKVEDTKAGIKTVITQERRVSEFAALVRDRDGAVLDVVGSRYAPRQNEEVFEFFNEFVKAGSATMETVGSLRGGRVVWGLANLKASFKLSSSDIVKGYLLVAMFHQQGKANIYKFTPVRVVCANTMAMALKEGGGFKDYHSTEFTPQTTEKAKQMLGIAREQLDEFHTLSQQLLKLNLTQKDVIRLLAPIYQEELADPVEGPPKAEVKWNAKLARVMDILERAPGQTPFSKGKTNGWNVLNAVTYYSDHIASRSADKRLTNAWMGKTGAQKEAVLAQLQEMV